MDRKDPNGPKGNTNVRVYVSLWSWASVGLSGAHRNSARGWPCLDSSLFTLLSKEVSKMSHPASLYIACDVIQNSDSPISKVASTYASISDYSEPGLIGEEM